MHDHRGSDFFFLPFFFPHDPFLFSLALELILLMVNLNMCHTEAKCEKNGAAFKSSASREGPCKSPLQNTLMSSSVPGNRCPVAPEAPRDVMP